MKTRYFPLFAVCGALAAYTYATRADSPQTQPGDPTTAPSLVLAMPMSAGLDEVEKLTKAGVAEPVVLAYVQNSSQPYHPSADEIIRLRSDGVSDQVIAAVLQRGGQVRTEMAQAQPAPYLLPQYAAQPAQVVAQPATPAPTVVYAPPQDDSDNTPNVVYIGGSYSYPYYPYGYAGYVGCYGWPWYYGGFYGRPGYFHGGYYGGFRGGRGFVGDRGGFVGGRGGFAGGHFGGGGGGRAGGGVGRRR